MLVHNQGKHRANRLFVLLMKKKEEGGRVKDVFCVFTREREMTENIIQIEIVH